MRFGAVLILASFLPAPAAAQSPGASLCGIPDGAIAAMHARVTADPRFTRDGGDAMREFYTSDALQAIWSFTTAKSPVHPAALCEQVVDRGGSMQIDRQTRCEADAAKCAAFQAEAGRRDEGSGDGE